MPGASHRMNEMETNHLTTGEYQQNFCAEILNKSGFLHFPADKWHWTKIFLSPVKTMLLITMYSPTESVCVSILTIKLNSEWYIHICNHKYSHWIWILIWLYITIYYNRVATQFSNLLGWFIFMYSLVMYIQGSFCVCALPKRDNITL